MIDINNDQLIAIFESALLPAKNCQHFDFLYDKYIKKEFDDEFFNILKTVAVEPFSEMVTDTYLFFINILGMEAPDALAAVNRILVKCGLCKIKDPRYHLVNDIRLKEAYKAKFKKNNFREFYIKYLEKEEKNK